MAESGFSGWSGFSGFSGHSGFSGFSGGNAVPAITGTANYQTQVWHEGEWKIFSGFSSVWNADVNELKVCISNGTAAGIADTKLSVYTLRQGQKAAYFNADGNIAGSDGVFIGASIGVPLIVRKYNPGGQDLIARFESSVSALEASIARDGTVMSDALTANTMLQANADKEIVSVAGSIPLYQSKVVLTPALLKDAADIELVPTAGANKIVIPEKIITSYVYADAAYTGGEFADIYYGAAATGERCFFDLGLTGVLGSVNLVSLVSKGSTQSTGALADFANKAIVIGGHTLAGASANGTLTIVTIYSIADIS
jgi:hypothetical protein